MYICGLIPQDFAELAEAVPIDASDCNEIWSLEALLNHKFHTLQIWHFANFTQCEEMVL